MPDIFNDPILGPPTPSPPAYALPNMIKDAQKTATDQMETHAATSQSAQDPADLYAGAKAATAAGNPPPTASDLTQARLQWMHDEGIRSSLSPFESMRVSGKQLFDMANTDLTHGYTLENGKVVSLPNWLGQQAAIKNAQMGLVLDATGNWVNAPGVENAKTALEGAGAKGQHLLGPDGKPLPNTIESAAQRANEEHRAAALGDAGQSYKSTPQTGITLSDAILQQESSGNPNAKPSTAGAIGVGQILPATFAQYAKPGESITNPADNAAVSRRMVDAYSQQYNGDPARVAVAYFSGPGNVAPPGSPTPWIRDIKDTNGKATSAYVGDVAGRLAPQSGPGAAPLTDAQRIGAGKQTIEHPGIGTMVNPVTNATAYYDPLQDDANFTNKRRLQAAGYMPPEALQGTDKVLYEQDNNAINTIANTTNALIDTRGKFSDYSSLALDKTMRSGKFEAASSEAQQWLKSVAPETYLQWHNGALTNQQAFQRASGEMLKPVLDDLNIKQMRGPELAFASRVGMGDVGTDPGAIRANLYLFDQALNQLQKRTDMQYNGLFPAPGQPRIHVLDSDRAFLQQNQDHFSQPYVNAARQNAQLTGIPNESVNVPDLNELPKGMTRMQWFDQNSKYWTPKISDAVRTYIQNQEQGDK